MWAFPTPVSPPMLQMSTARPTVQFSSDTVYTDPTGETFRPTRLSPVQMPATSSGSSLCLSPIQLNCKSGPMHPFLGSVVWYDNSQHSGKYPADISLFLMKEVMKDTSGWVQDGCTDKFKSGGGARGSCAPPPRATALPGPPYAPQHRSTLNPRE